ncbi:histone deacetylase 10 isoform X2 [Iris pallida]|uniref:Histone deacetylase 10 isoform X2 n=1 Tax=Iris pallida TaxID=29817 RepID=A0AAX6HI99_IRIPA|nr:histone deacetylase 10 isoform X2 [Iris pallida]
MPPQTLWDIHVDHHASCDLQKVSVLPFCYAILCRCVCTGGLMLYPLCWQVFCKYSVCILRSIVRLQYLHNFSILSLDMFVKIPKNKYVHHSYFSSSTIR